jgi:hypothetical protein
MEREEDRLPCSGAEEMSACEAEKRWRGRRGGEGKRGGECRCRGGAAERSSGVLSRLCGEVSFFYRMIGAGGLADKIWLLGCIMAHHPYCRGGWTSYSYS